VTAAAARRGTGFAAFAVLLVCIPLANWMLGHVGTACPPGGPCLVPVLPGLLAPSGVLTAGVALVARDAVQRCLGAAWGLAAVAAGALLSALVAPAALALASGAAFGFSELAEFAVFTPLQRRGLMLAVLVSAVAGLLVDSAVFLQLGFGSLLFLPGQVAGKLWAVLASLPVVRLLRRVAPQPA
jgi:queuosine precursor transporter